MSSKSRRGPNPHKKQERLVREARKHTKLRWAIYAKENGKWSLVETFDSPQDRDAYFEALLELNPDHELRRVDL